MQYTTFSQPFTTPTDILMDSDYIGKPVKLFTQTNDLRPIIELFTHVLDT